MPEFNAIRVHLREGHAVRVIERCHSKDLPPGEVLIQVHYSSLNYKDALSASGHSGITRHYPHTPGIDAAGVVVTSDDPAWRSGDEVLVSGYDLGMNTDGGFGGYVRVPAAWVMARPAGLSLRECMIYGTAGFTAALCVAKLQHMDIMPEEGEILVTGASGGVGSVSVALLAHLGYQVTALSGKPEATDWLRALGATDVIGREALVDDPRRPLLKARWAGVIDSVGGDLLGRAVRSVRPGGSVATCGLTAGVEVPLTVYPFILRGVSLLGVDGASTPMLVRQAIWQKLAKEWKLPNLTQILSAQISLEQAEGFIEKILRGAVQGRVVIAHTLT
jgi:acrylyl-CoA reductase (NADPH)